MVPAPIMIVLIRTAADACTPWNSQGDAYSTPRNRRRSSIQPPGIDRGGVHVPIPPPGIDRGVSIPPPGIGSFRLELVRGGVHVPIHQFLPGGHPDSV